MRRRDRHYDEGGFTLVEVLVTVLILGLLAAVVFPVVADRISSADPTKASNDFANIRTGVELFQLDVRTSLPGDMEDLAQQIQAAGGGSDANVQTNNYSTGESNKWDGPYVDVAVATTSPDAVVVTTGFEGSILNRLRLFNSASTTANAMGSPTVGDFLALRITGLGNTEFARLNDEIDGETESDADDQDLGKLRFAEAATTSATADTTYFLAVPFKN